MGRPATKDELLELISRGLVDFETAINDHPVETVLLYEKGRNAFIAGQVEVEETDWSRAVDLTLLELSLMNRYLLASAFVSAWHDHRNDTTRRDQATSPVCMLVSALGFSIEDVMNRYIEFETAWQTLMNRHI